MVYEPQSGRLTESLEELDKLYNELNVALDEITGMVFICGDFNAKIGKRQEGEECMGRYTRGRRNTSGQTLVDFCEANCFFVSNSAFQHKAAHITTWESKRQINDKCLTIYNQIDFILCKQDMKRNLRNSRSYAGTRVHSDHRIVIAKYDIRKFRVYLAKNQRKNQARRFDCSKLANDDSVRKENQKVLDNKLDGIENWDDAVVAVQKAAEEVVGYVQKMGKVKSDSEMERLSLQQISLRLKIKQAQKHEKTLFLKKKRELIVRKMAQRKKHQKENELDGLVEEANSAEKSAKMFAAIRALKRKPYENPFVNDENGKRIVQADEIARVVESHFKNHFFKPDEVRVDRFTGDPRRLDQPISFEEVKRSVKSLKNGRACGHDNINVELLKYAPDKVMEIITRALNQIFEEHKDLDLGRGVLIALPKPGKCKGPIKNLRPITLFTTIRKILSIVTLNRIKPDCDSYLSTSQCAYRSGRSTTDIVWAYKWVIARAQKTKTSVFSTGIDLSSAFDTIRRENLLGITESFLDEDVLISDKSMELRINGAKQRPKFGTNIGSPQGDGLSGMLFNIYFEDALRHVRQLLEEGSNKTEDHTYAVDDKPKEFVYADDSDFLSLEENDDSVQKIEETLKVYNLTVNVDKTEKIVIKRGERLEEFWRKSKKLASLLGDEEDLARDRQCLGSEDQNLSPKKAPPLQLTGEADPSLQL